jgi:integrase
MVWPVFIAFEIVEGRPQRDDRRKWVIDPGELGWCVDGVSEYKSTGISYLVRSRAGTYYWQAKIGGRSRRGSLKTKSQSVAKTRITRAIEKARAEYAGALELRSELGKLETFGDWCVEWLRVQSERVRIKASTLADYEKRADLLKRSELGEIPVRVLKSEDLRRWWRKECEQWEPVTVNHKLRVLKAVLSMCWKARGLGESPAECLERRPVRKRLRVMPSGEDVKAVAESIRRQGKRNSREVAAMVEFMAYSGCRPGELRELAAEDIQGDWLSVRGGKEGTKNREERLLPINDHLAAVIDRERMRKREGKLFTVSSPVRALSNACERLGMPKIRPYDLRHFFITSCIESGVDVATVAKWAGHKDGGVLILRTYTHTRADHSLSEARRVKFG